MTPHTVDLSYSGPLIEWTQTPHRVDPSCSGPLIEWTPHRVDPSYSRPFIELTTHAVDPPYNHTVDPLDQPVVQQKLQSKVGSPKMGNSENLVLKYSKHNHSRSLNCRKWLCFNAECLENYAIKANKIRDKPKAVCSAVTGTDDSIF